MKNLFAAFRFRLLLLFCCACCVLQTHAQIVISGQVTDPDERPLAQASVFVNSSTLGTTTGTNGEFALNVGKGGFVELVISHVGFEPLLYRLEGTQPAKRFVFRLQPKVQTLRSVVILSATMRKKWLQLFKDNFFGITQAGKNCRILNETEVQFETGPGGSITAFSVQPLIVVNKELGYRIHFQLINFSYTEDRTSFIGFSRFEELNDRTAKTKAQIRKKYYEGSSAHFFRSLINNRLAAAGFSMRLLRPISMEAPKTIAARQEQQGAGSGQPAGKMMYALPVVPDSIMQKVVEDGTFDQYRLQWTGRLQVQFNKDPYAKAYLSKQVLLMSSVPKGVNCFIELQEPFALMDAGGALADPMALSFGGFWSYEKLGSMLPADYSIN